MSKIESFRLNFLTMKTSIYLKLAQFCGVIGALAATALSAVAQSAPTLTYNGASTYKDAKGAFYQVTPSPLDITYSNVNTSRSIYSDACGYAKVSFSERQGNIPTGVTFGGINNSIGNLPLVDNLKYKCTNGVVSGAASTQTGAFKVESVSNNLQIVTIYYPLSRTGGANKLNVVSYISNLTNSLKPTCGFVTFTPTDSTQRRTSSNFSIAGSTVDMSTLPINPTPPACMAGKLYTPGSISTGGSAISRTDKAVFLKGLTPNSINVVGFDVLESQSFKTESCGLARIDFGRKVSKIPSSIKLGANSYNTASMPISSAYSSVDCNNSIVANMPVNTLYKIGSNSFIAKTSDLTKSSLTIEKLLTATRNVPVNACGFTTIQSPNKLNGFTAGDKLVVNGSAPYTVMSLPLATSSLSCKNGITYTATESLPAT